MTTLHEKDLEAQWCPRCDTWHTLHAYSPARKGRLGSWCKACIAKRKNEHPANPDRPDAYWRWNRRTWRNEIRTLIRDWVER